MSSVSEFPLDVKNTLTILRNLDCLAEGTYLDYFPKFQIFNTGYFIVVHTCYYKEQCCLEYYFNDGRYCNHISFETFFEVCSEEIKEELIWHLDLFKS